MAKNSSYSLHYLNQEFAAMRWLATQGLRPDEIRELRWGQIDETDRTITIRQRLVNILYDRDSGQISRREYDHKIKIPLVGSGCEYFFLKSKTPSLFWVFTEHRPKGWRREESREALFPLEVVEKCCQDLQIQNTSPLTFLDECGTIEISKLNIHKSKTTELIREAELVVEANE